MEGFLNPKQILDKLYLKENMTAVEFGCGAGIFALALAEKLKKGKVYGLDVQEEKLSALRNKALLKKLTNVFTIHCDLETKSGSTLHGNYADAVLIPNVLFQAENKCAIIEESKRVLKPGGQLLIIDWQKSSSLAPKQGVMPSDEMKKTAGDIGFVFKEEFPAGEHHFALLFNKQI